MRYLNTLILFFAFVTVGCVSEPYKTDRIAIIPMPSEISTPSDEVFYLDSKTPLVYDARLKNTIAIFQEQLEGIFNVDRWDHNTPSEKSITFKINTKIKNEEAYELIVTPEEIHIQAKTERGIFYGIQSLLQLIPIDIQDHKVAAIPCLVIKDQPEFKYRGMHLDVGRHLYSVDFIKKYIDMMARLKMNTFHWHLTEDQGWRIEIKKYPKLQEIAAFRETTLVGHYNDVPHQFDGKRYGGYYTQEQIKEIVAYAEARQVTIIPEIEMPGHSQAAIAAYPALGCTGNKVKVATKWGVFEEIYCPKESTFKFLEDVIDEVVELFPGNYIHIGGDEAPKTRWKNCPHCQKLIKEKGLKDEDELQRYFIERMEKYLNSKGKQLIGWDEILEGGLTPNATVMSWRGTKGAIEAAKAGHYTIMTPTSHCYFDYYQSDNEKEPLAIGGFLPLEKVYGFHPIPKELTEKESRYVLGAQGNVWTEYMPNEKDVEYMAFPRMIALSEVVWSKAENKDYADFINRLELYHKRLDAWNVNYANHLYDVTGELKNHRDQLTFELDCPSDSYPIYFSIDGSEPFLKYNRPIDVNASMRIKAVVKDGNQKLGRVFTQEINFHKGIDAEVRIDEDPHPSYNAGGKEALINGITGSNQRYGDKEWLGFWGVNIKITMKFRQPKKLNKIKTRFYNGHGQWIYAPKHIAARIILEDGDVVANKFIVNQGDISPIIPVDMRFSTRSPMVAKEIVLMIPNYGEIPEGKQGAGHKAWTFIDEIVIE